MTITASAWPGKESEMNEQAARGQEPSGAKRVYASYREEIGAMPETVFSLLCPVAEYQWIEGWNCTLVYTKSGGNEEGCIFREEITGPALTGKPIASTWLTNRYDPEHHAVQFVIFTGDSAVVRYTVQLEALAESRTAMAMNFELTPMDGETLAMNEGEIRSRLLAVVTFISQSLKHYCETGKMLKAV